MKELNQLVGKRLLWTGSERDHEEGTCHQYLLFEDNLGVSINDSGEITVLTDATDTLEQLLRARIDEAKGLVALERALADLKKPAEQP